MEKGRDPVAEEHAQRAQRERDGLTLADLIAEYIEDQRRSGVATVREIERALNRDIVPTLGHFRPAEITDLQIEDVIDGVAERGNAMARHLLVYLRGATITLSGVLLSFATDTASPTIPPTMLVVDAAANPASTVGHRSMIATSTIWRSHSFGTLSTGAGQTHAPSWR